MFPFDLFLFPHFFFELFPLLNAYVFQLIFIIYLLSLFVFDLTFSQKNQFILFPEQYKLNDDTPQTIIMEHVYSKNTHYYIKYLIKYK